MPPHAPPHPGFNRSRGGQEAPQMSCLIKFILGRGRGKLYRPDDLSSMTSAMSLGQERQQQSPSRPTWDKSSSQFEDTTEEESSNVAGASSSGSLSGPLETFRFSSEKESYSKCNLSLIY